MWASTRVMVLGSCYAPNGTQISFTIDSGPGGFTTYESVHDRRAGRVPARSGLSSAVTGVTTVRVLIRALAVGGGHAHTPHRTATGANPPPAVKTWVNAKIAITPDAVNRGWGAPHTLTVTLG